MPQIRRGRLLLPIGGPHQARWTQPVHSHGVFVGQKTTDVRGIEQALCHQRFRQIPKATHSYELHIFLVSDRRQILPFELQASAQKLRFQYAQCGVSKMFLVLGQFRELWKRR